MAIRDAFKFTRKTFFNPAGWMDVDYIANQSNLIKDVLYNLFSKPTAPAREETFEQAMARLDLTEDAVNMGATNYRLFALCFLLIGLLVFFYSFYIVFRYKSVVHFVLSLCVSGLLFAYAFKYDFWSLQMRKRKLGITPQEWLANLLGGKGKPS